MRGPLLSKLNSNPKTYKNQKVLGVSTATLHLAPGSMSGHNVCPKSSAGCRAACLHFAGSPVYYAAKTQARIAKTKLFFADRDLFMNILVLEIEAHIRKSARDGYDVAVRLNATSDIIWERILFNTLSGRLSIFEHFPYVQFYDYTAIPRRVVAPNYDLTFSLKENNQADAIQALKAGMNVAVVFEEKLPARFRLGDSILPVIDGDEHDYRPSDRRGVIVGLKAKGRAGKADQTGFIDRLAA